MTNEPVLVIGGTGKTGRRVVAGLTERGVAVRVASRSSEQRFDWLDESTWGPALEGVGAVYAVPLEGVPVPRSFTELAARSGVRRIVLLSARGVDVPGYYGDGEATDGEKADEEEAEGAASHLQGEQVVRDSGLEWTILRPGWFAQNFSEGLFLDSLLAGELRLPVADGAATFVDLADVAAVAVAALTEDGHTGQVYEMSGPRAVDLETAVAEIAEATGRRIRYVPVTVDRFTAELRQEGLSAEDAELWAAALNPIRRGLEAKISDGVRRALGRDPRDFTEFVTDAAAAGAWRG
ncbi:NAD(P)H-binding protein [Streptomyces sp. QH1-20]|uniref:NAD(P)H-binding protein n=1 Tax=Streptomyces sp. QH1-20 TaxID=3240934 RepID=UPI003511BA19